MRSYSNHVRREFERVVRESCIVVQLFQDRMRSYNNHVRREFERAVRESCIVVQLF